MSLTPTASISESELQSGMKLIIKDGLTTEVMNVLSSGTFLVATALLLGASNFQIGLIAALPSLMNAFQLLSLWLVRRYKNRKAISVFCSVLARIPLILIGCIPFLINPRSGIFPFIIFLSFYYCFAAIAGPSWNSWMKDIIPEKQLGNFFSKRTRKAQVLNVIVSLLMAFIIDYTKQHYPGNELTTYSIMYIVAGTFGLIGTSFLYRTPETPSQLSNQNIFKLILQPLKDNNFLNLLIFNSVWSFAINIATPFFTVYMMTSLHLPISYIIGLGIVAQLCSILTIRIWGMYADRYSNKTIIAIAGPLYILCILAWCFVGIFQHFYSNIILLVFINIFTGVATAGINLSLINIGLKLAPAEDSIAYLSAKNIFTSVFASIAPLVGGALADFFANRHLDINTVYQGPRVVRNFHLLSLHQWNFLFIIGAGLALVALQFLGRVKEQGEVEKDTVVRIMRSSMKNTVKDYFIIGTLLDWHEHLSSGFSKFFTSRKIEKKLEEK